MPKLISTNPAKNYQVLGYVNVSSLQEIKQKVTAAQKAKAAWKELGVAKRVKILRPLLREFAKRKEELALLMTREMGKPLKESLDDIEWEKDYFEWFLENGEKYLSEEITFKDKKSIHKILYEPVGVAAVIVPWNFPYDNFVWAVIPNLIAGNTVVFKHSEECPLTGKLIEEVMEKIDSPKGVFSEVYGNGEVGEALVNQDVDLVWFTGSSKVGKHLYEIAGKKFVKSVLEMGGSNPGIVFDDVDIGEVVEKLYSQRFSNCGQVCDALKRLIVHQSIFDKLVESLKKVVESKLVGDPEDERTDIGPLVAKRQLELLESQVEEAVKNGAKVITGAKRPENLEGAYYLPTILTGIKPGMRVWREETFGPVLPVVSFKTEEEAVKLANDTVYGLGAQIYTKDKKRALKVAAKIEAGAVTINDVSHFLPYNPFGGCKDSGVGREHGRHGFQELTQIKVVSVEK